MKNIFLDNITDRWFEQKLTHFEPGDIRTWKQRYFVNSDHYDVGTLNVWIWVLYEKITSRPTISFFLKIKEAQYSCLSGVKARLALHGYKVERWRNWVPNSMLWCSSLSTDSMAKAIQRRTSVCRVLNSLAASKLSLIWPLSGKSFVYMRSKNDGLLTTHS